MGKRDAIPLKSLRSPHADDDDDDDDSIGVVTRNALLRLVYEMLNAKGKEGAGVLSLRIGDAALFDDKELVTCGASTATVCMPFR